MERPAEAERKRHPDVPADGAAVGQFGAGQESDQGRLADAVGAKDPDIAAGLEGGRRIVEDDLAAGRRRIGLADVLQHDHSAALSLRRRPRSSPNPHSNARIARTSR